MPRPIIQNREAAIRIYYSHDYINGNHIREIFGNIGSAKLAEMRKEVLAKEKELNIPTVVPRHICTEVAFEVWGIDIDKLVKHYNKLKKIGLS